MVSSRTHNGAISGSAHTPQIISINGLPIYSTAPASTAFNKLDNRKHGSSLPTRVTKHNNTHKTISRSSQKASMQHQHEDSNATTELTEAELLLLDTATKQGRRRSTGPTASKASRRTSAALKAHAAEPDTVMSNEETLGTNNIKMPEDTCPGNAVWPSVIFGEPGPPLSLIGRADKEVEMWEEILITHQENVPHSVPAVELQLQKAKDHRAQLDDTLAENHRVGDIDPAASFIKKRLETLQWALDTSKFGPEGENIKCAMEGYRSGAIKFTDQYTIIWGGKIVDSASTYNDFMFDRTERLDRYFAAHGEGWLWWEPPLNVHPDTRPTRMMGSAMIDRGADWTSMGHYKCNMGFWKRARFVHRMAYTIVQTKPAFTESLFQWDKTDPELVNCQNEGPRLAFNTLLDSGATYPNLHNSDYVKLGIDFMYYGAQSVSETLTSNGTINSRVFELFACVLDENGDQLVDPQDAVWPNSHHYLGGLTPCTESGQLDPDPNGNDSQTRLSGMLPFIACYVSATPTRPHLYLGEDRNDVLGHHRMPGQRKFNMDDPYEAGQYGQWAPHLIPYDRWDDPSITFSHHHGRMIDQDAEITAHESSIKFIEPTGPGSQSIEVVSNPARSQLGSNYPT